jgi:hypothetical protein
MVFGDTGDEGSLRIVIDLTSAFFNGSCAGGRRRCWRS